MLKALLDFFRSPVDKALDIALERTEDVDRRNALALEALKLREETKRQALARVTIPWVDALHKMARPLYWAGVTAGVFVLIAMGKGPELKEYAEFILSAVAGGGVYTLLKGRGR